MNIFAQELTQQDTLIESLLAQLGKAKARKESLEQSQATCQTAIESVETAIKEIKSHGIVEALTLFRASLEQLFESNGDSGNSGGNDPPSPDSPDDNGTGAEVQNTHDASQESPTPQAHDRNGHEITNGDRVKIVGGSSIYYGDIGTATVIGQNYLAVDIDTPASPDCDSTGIAYPDSFNVVKVAPLPEGELGQAFPKPVATIADPETGAQYTISAVKDNETGELQYSATHVVPATTNNNGDTAVEKEASPSVVEAQPTDNEDNTEHSDIVHLGERVIYLHNVGEYAMSAWFGFDLVKDAKAFIKDAKVAFYNISKAELQRTSTRTGCKVEVVLEGDLEISRISGAAKKLFGWQPPQDPPKLETKLDVEEFSITVDGSTINVEYSSHYNHLSFISPYYPLEPIPVSETGYLLHCCTHKDIEAVGTPQDYAIAYCHAALRYNPGKQPSLKQIVAVAQELSLPHEPTQETTSAQQLYSDQDRALFSPLFQRYLATKDANPGKIVLFHVGDFYETFFQDAEIISEALELVITSKNSGNPQAGRIPMAGFPDHTLQRYCALLEEKGYNILVIEKETPQKLMPQEEEEQLALVL
ncbi:MAG: hypothetical protein F6K47_04140 [Symploca sp. SIO2E6]|nr:hypothetical protein [Symploca sp. SIO2E6]